MVDIHCHILPEVDDGAADWPTALAMCRMAAADGIRHIVATPHANEEYRYDRAAHQQRLDELQQRTEAALTLSLGCDFHLSFENIQSALEDPARFCIAGTHYLLVEFSDYVIPPNTTQVLRQFGDLGVTPVLTHPERNPILQREMKRVLEWADQGSVVQVTANALTGRWGNKASKAAKFLFEHRAVHVVASDAHSTHSRPPVLSEARAYIAAHYDQDLAEALVEHNPAAIISGGRLPYFPSTR